MRGRKPTDHWGIFTNAAGEYEVHVGKADRHFWGGTFETLDEAIEARDEMWSELNLLTVFEVRDLFDRFYRRPYGESHRKKAPLADGESDPRQRIGFPPVPHRFVRLAAVIALAWGSQMPLPPAQYVELISDLAEVLSDLSHELK